MENTIEFRSETRTPRSHSRRMTAACGTLALLCLLTMLLSGCAARALRTDYKDYENSYAESSNRQMLLNLARLSEHHPTYFFKMGQITTNYRYQATLSGNGTYSPPNYPAGPGGGGTPGALYEKDPGFSFVPVNDDATAEQLLKPMNPELFYLLFQQGWRVDQLLRLMVDHIEYMDPTNGQLRIIRNEASASNKVGYWTFLRISALAYHLQRSGHLVFAANQKFVPIISGLPLNDAGKTAPSAKDIADALSKNLVWQPDPDPTKKDSWQLGQFVTEPTFKLTPVYVKGNKDANKSAYEVDIDMPELSNVLSLDPTLQILDSNGLGFGIRATTQTGDTSKPPTCVQQASDPSKPSTCSQGSAQLVMRSLIGMMAAAAQEQDKFKELMDLLDEAVKDTVKVPHQDPLPEVEKQPLLTLTFDRADESRLTSVLTKLEYMGKTYAVGDLKTDDPRKDPSWNRDNFRIITQLVSLITVDISKFPPQQILQLRTQ
jgi:hypothetical protein